MNPKSEPIKIFQFEVFRYSAGRGVPPRMQSYRLSAGKNMSVLEALLHLQDEQDPSLAFRHSCRGAVCGSCAMSINGRLNLACRVLLGSIPSGRVVLEPLPGFEVLKDLVVDMDLFWEKYRRIHPWLHSEILSTEETRMSEDQREQIDQYVNCILCGLCDAACPVWTFDPAFTGPAALAKLYRFLADSREDRPGEVVEGQNSTAGVWGCHTIMKCRDVCPRNVRPTDGIRGLRWHLLGRKVKQIFGRK
jgi:succinate dehydrogenase / fumarate reductase iron-sulfur subunit